MMGYEDHGYEEAHLHLSNDQMASLPISGENLPRSNGSNRIIDDPLAQSSMFVDIPTDDSDLPQSQSGTQHPNSIHSILEPPSYAEAVFRSFDSESVDDDFSPIHDRSILESSSSFSSSDYLRISVSDPQREIETTGSLVPGSGYYISYLITTFTNLPDYEGSEFNVRRRFKDVVLLADQLAENFRGYFIPLRPDKNVVESQVMQKNEFVEQRRMALEKYLKQLSKHPVIRKSVELRNFLTSSGRLALARANNDVPSRVLESGSVSDVSAVSPVKGGGRDLFRLFKELKQSVVNDWGGAKPPIVEEDKEFLERKVKLQDLEQQLSLVSVQAESLVKAQQDIGETVGQLGMALVKLTKFETEEALYDSQRARAADMKNVATASVKASRLYRELNAQTVKHLDKLHDYLGVMLAVNNACSDRSSALLRVQALLTDLSSLNSRIEKLEAASSKIFGGDSSRIRKIEELRETVRATEDVKNCAISEYEQIKENNRNELERLDTERRDDFVNMLKGFVVNQAGYAEKMATIWGTVAEQTSRYVRK